MTVRTITILAIAGLAASATPAMSSPQRAPHGIKASSVRSTAARNGPTLAETLEFIRSRLNQQGKINYAGFLHDAADNSNWVNQFDVEATNVTADAAACAINLHWTTAIDGKNVQDRDSSFKFATLESVTLTSMEQDTNQLSARAGHPTWTARVNPPIWVVTASRPDGTNFVMDFRDRSVAERVAKAMKHAILLCGTGKREAF